MILALLLAPPCPAQGSSPATSQPAEEKPWKIEEAHGPTRRISFETDEGTWIALDVHPDGKRLVFSLLGDLYLLPIEGGEARAITSGPAYDVQPRFSPDGTAIAFASDREGIEALWVCDPEGKEARRVSAEKEGTVNSPCWSPDGDWLVGRKRLTDTSSLGTVELWMWHRKGGAGVRLTKKEEQPDAADPEFSRDGRFLYFSARDARYKYDRDVNEGIWQLKRLDRRTGQTLPIAGEFGGSARPTLSPDGKTLAFVRRVRARTVLSLMDLDSGRTWPLTEEVERDNQEGFAFHGVFPGFDWTPDGKSILATAQGRIWRIDATTRERRPIPFRAAVDQTVTEALRFPRRLGGEKVRARILRWPVESPDGRRLVFSAVGHLYAMDLPSGAPRRLTSLEEFEYAPAFSPDGKSLAFVTWKDKGGGQVWVAPFGEGGLGTPRQVTQVAAQYANPSFSADGKRLVFLKGSGATFRGHDPAEELWHEVHWAEAAGGPSRFVIGIRNRGTNRRMSRPQFSADGERIFLLDDEDPGKPFEVPKTTLVSVRLDGTDRRAHLRWAKVEEAAPSPDGRWVAFQEQHEVHVTALPSEVGKEPVEVAAEDPALPVARLSEAGGEWVGWAEGGRTLTWILGPTYRRLPLEKAFPAAGERPEPPKKEEKRKPPASEAIEIVLDLLRARPSGLVAYAGARLVTMRGEEVVERGTILVEGDRIRAVGASSAVEVPPGAKVVDLAGKTVIPGLFDEHAHLHYSTLDVLPQRPWKYLANLAYGVTTTHDPSASTHEAFAGSEMVEAGLVPGPRIFSTGYVLYGADDPDRAVVKSLEDARAHLRRMKALGAFTVKSYMQPKREQRQMLLQAAREEGLMVVPEGGGDLEMDMTLVLDGHTTIEHALPVTPLRKDVATLLGRSGTAYTPTLLVAYGGLSGDKWFHQHFEIWKDEKLLRFVPQGVVDPIGRIRDVMATDEDWHHLDVAASARKVVQAGGRVCLGGHGQMQGLGPHWEIWAFVQGGMTPLEALRVATLSPAQALGLDADLGSIEAGKLADFVVLERNPLEAIENTDSVALVVKNGVAYPPEELARER
ncbi:MAG: amidohydrolase family protein [Planctomycetes bacterium]|nr:amidohydrolase family protein [Planctomycetota bacterium]